MNLLHEKRRLLQQLNNRYGTEFLPIPKEQWPVDRIPHEGTTRYAVTRNRDFLVQVFTEKCGFRITVNRTSIDRNGNWTDGITWDELQAVKNANGFKDYDMVEIYPKASDLVYEANMRHLWALDQPLPCVWRNKTTE